MNRLVIRVWFRGTQQYFTMGNLAFFGVTPVISYTCSNNEFCEIDWR